METNKKILGPLGVIFTIIGAIVSLIVGGFTLYFYFKKDNPKLEVTTYSEQLITQQRNIDNLRAIYIYKDSLEVNNLWQVKYIIRNIGKKTIVGKGVNSMLIEDGVGYSFSDNANVLYCDINHNDIDAKLDNNSIKFSQWQANEYIEIDAVIESSTMPKFSIDNRDIVDAEIRYSQLITNHSKEPKLIQFVPKEFALILKYVWIVYQLMFMFVFGCIIYMLIKKGIIKKRSLPLLNAWGVKIYLSYKLMLLLICIILMTPILWMF